MKWIKEKRKNKNIYNMTKLELIANLKEKQKIIDKAISFIHILKNNLKEYTEYEEYTKIFNEMLNDILEILGDKENE